MRSVQKLLLLLPFLMLSQVSLGRTSAPLHENGLGAVIEYANPFTYLFGAIINMPENPNRVFRGKNGKLATLLTVQPAHVFELYTEELLLCGNRAEDFKDAIGPIVITYKTQAHEMVDGVSCHELQSVYQVKAKEE